LVPVPAPSLESEDTSAEYVAATGCWACARIREMWGTILRTEAAFGGHGKFCLPANVDLWKRQSVSSGMGAHFSSLP